MSETSDIARKVAGEMRESTRTVSVKLATAQHNLTTLLKMVGGWADELDPPQKPMRLWVQGRYTIDPDVRWCEHAPGEYWREFVPRETP